MQSVFNRCDGRHGRGKESDKEREASERERELKEASDLAETSERTERERENQMGLAGGRAP